MCRVALVAGLGLITALGRGEEANIRGLRRAKAQYRTQTLTDFEETIEAPYLMVPEKLEDASEHYHQLIDNVVHDALQQAGISESDKKQMPIFLGSSSFHIAQSEALFQSALASAQDPLVLEPLALSTIGFSQFSAYLRQSFELYGEDYAFNTACTSGANALLAAARSIDSAYSDYALVIGIELFNKTTLAGFYGMQLLADEVMRPFDQRRNGMVLGEGCAAIVLKAADMVADSHGLIVVGGASCCDTYSVTASNPDGSIIAKVMQAALRDVGIGYEDVVAIKAHGTASPLSDTGEAQGMKRVFDKLPPFFTLKPYIGHTLGASGVIETAMLAALLQRGFLPASAGFELRDESLGVAPITSPIDADCGYYMLNSFGFGGNNNSLILRYR